MGRTQRNFLSLEWETILEGGRVTSWQKAWRYDRKEMGILPHYYLPWMDLGIMVLPEVIFHKFKDLLISNILNHLSGYFPIVLAMYCRTTYNDARAWLVNKKKILLLFTIFPFIVVINQFLKNINFYWIWTKKENLEWQKNRLKRQEKCNTYPTHIYSHRV